MQANTFDVIERRKRIIFFKLGKLWVFKQFFDNHELFNALLDYYNKDCTASSSSPQVRGTMPYKAPGAQRLRLRLSGGSEKLRGRAPQISKICTDPEELRGLQGNRERENIPDEGPGGSRGSCGLWCKNSRRRDCLRIT